MFTGEIAKLSTHSLELDPLLLEMCIGVWCLCFLNAEATENQYQFGKFHLKMLSEEKIPQPKLK